jgi:S-(hydroxymethyl)glutathione dehydrogenase/alcohol dehydrogenase
MRGIVWTGQLEVRDDLRVRAPGPREVKVRIAHAGLCHSDVSVLDGTVGGRIPAVLGHEAAGVVEEVGPAVTSVEAGDHVVLTTLANCGQCAACDRGQPTRCRRAVGADTVPGRFTVGGADVFPFANIGAFSEHVVVFETQCVVIDRDVPMKSACLIGCAVLTGAGAVFNRARVQPGECVAVIGAGGIGLSVVQAARLSSAGRIVVIDTNPAKEAVARHMGATDFIDASSSGDVLAVLRQLGLPDGVDYAFECVGHPDLIRQAIDMLDIGGSCVILGVPKIGTEVSFVVFSMYNDKSILGCRYGSSRPHHDIPLIVDLYRSGRFFLDEMVTQVYDLQDIGRAISDLRGGRLNRAVLEVAGT